MTLHADDRVRYARHLLLPEIGEAGQERLLALRVRFAAEADAGASAIARDYLERAGVRVEPPLPPGEGRGEGTLALPDTAALQALAGTPELLEAARALTGALAAVEAVKATLSLGAPNARALQTLSSEEV